MRIDLHVHTRERSVCAHSSTAQMVRAALARDLDGFVITDHDSLIPEDRLAYLNAKYAPFRIFGGVEVTTDIEHVLVLGVRDRALARGRWEYSELHAFVKDRDGFLALAHPFRFSSQRVGIDVERWPPHALEAFSWNTPRSAQSRIQRLAHELGTPILSNSDAHHASEVGPFYNELEREPRDSADLVAMLNAGAFTTVAPARVTSCRQG